MRIPFLLVIVAFLAASSLASDIPPASIDALGGAELFRIDTAHSYLGFSIKFLGMTDVRGTFRDYDASILYDDNHPERTSVTLVIDTASIDTNIEFRDKDLKTAKFFDVEKNPHIVFQSTSIEPKGNEHYVVHGNLTIKGITRPIAIPMTRTTGRVADGAWGNIRIAGNGMIIIRRKDFGILGNEFWGDKTLGDDVSITLEILGIRPNYDEWSFDSEKKPSIGEVLQKTLETEGAPAAAARLRELKRDHSDDYNFAPGELGLLINRLMQRRKVTDALELLKAGDELYPQEPRFFARSGEAYATIGDREQAIRMYEKAAALSPFGTESMEMLRRLKAR